jgi:hypothetical protein
MLTAVGNFAASGNFNRTQQVSFRQITSTTPEILHPRSSADIEM